ncbi:type III PLP-dependent enzyme domain-containing protein [Streptomyces millisiae]|uniref:Type III PLP-dependent enzyme n=1 Tax=Streptomyces millisiae TaxID=3075542 RepID=A0ABU2LRW7_9ACTN|nr:type III PLP-dependent enzyme [Streptomyces sp. DSM 44918]MDT0319783.1 type III PLP-dependent enzyme [Streptomyces sp. DSM 44918]
MSTHAELAERHGTPLYVYDLDRVDAARRELFAALPAGVDLYYALKANPHPDLVRALRAGPGRPCRAEISSVGELAAALAAGCPADECLYTGPGKTDTELDQALAAGVRLFSVESPGDLRRIGAHATRHGVTADCLLRVNAATGTATTSIRMTGRPSQFGMDSETLPGLMPELLAVPGTRIVGAHLFTMSNAKDQAGLFAELEHAVELATRLAHEAGLPLEYLDIGGGFAAPYAVPGRRDRYPRLRAGLERLLDERLPRWRDATPRVACESGRYLVGDSGTLLTRVVNIKESRGSTFVILDAGINAVGGLSGLGRLLPAAVGVEGPVGDLRASLVGPLCTPGDTLARDVPLPALEPGDVVAVPNVGAYGVTASLMGFLSRPAPTEVVVRAGEVVSVSRLEPRRVHEPVKAAVG